MSLGEMVGFTNPCKREVSTKPFKIISCIYEDTVQKCTTSNCSDNFLGIEESLFIFVTALQIEVAVVIVQNIVYKSELEGL